MEQVLGVAKHFSNMGFSGRAAKVAVLCIAAAVSGCAAQPEVRKEVPQSAEKLVGERSQARWNALLANKMQEAYQFYSPASREVLSYEDFIRATRVGFWKAVQVDKVVCASEDACEAQFTIEYTYRGSTIRTPATETWIRRDGTWWYVQKG